MCGLGEDLDQIWQTIEGGSDRGVEDAAHWVRVYQELVATSEAFLEDMRRGAESGSKSASLDQRLSVFRNRLRYWRTVLEGSQETDR
jgi:hypothetical protein